MKQLMSTGSALCIALVFDIGLSRDLMLYFGLILGFMYMDKIINKDK